MARVRRILFIVGILLMLYPCIVPKLRKTETEGAIGMIEIPKIEVVLPIYRGASEQILEKGIGQLEVGDSIFGGQGTHCLLAGHRGHLKGEFFLRLGELKKGDIFYIEANEQKKVYRVCEIRVVRPEDTKGLTAGNAEKELVSLITCTPYGMNTHRLIVTGEEMEEK